MNLAANSEVNFKISGILTSVTMYESYFDLKERPFSISPDPRFIYLSAQHQEALAKSQYAISQKMGISTIYGDIGAGNVVKLVNNMLAFIHMMGAAEAMVLGAKAGVDPNIIWQAVKASSGSSFVWESGTRAILRDKLAPTFTIDLASKDIGLAVDLGKEFGVPLKMGSAAQELIKHYQATGYAKEDVLATVKELEK